MENSNILRPADICQILGIHISTLYRWMDEGIFTVPKIQIGSRAVGFRQSDFDEWLESRTEKPEQKSNLEPVMQ